MRNPSYLAKSTHGIFYFRWPIPKSLHPKKIPTTLKVSLRTRNSKKALQLSRSMIQIGEWVNDQGMNQQMRYDEVRSILEKHFRDLLSQARERINSNGRLSPLSRQTLEVSVGLAEEALQKNIPLNFLTEPDDRKTIQGILDKYDLQVKEDDPAYEWFKHELKTSYQAYCKAVLNYDDELDKFVFSNSSEIQRTKLSDDIGMSLTELAQRYVKEKKSGSNWTDRTNIEKNDHIKLLYEILGSSSDVTKLNVMSAARVKDILQRYPRNRFKMAATKNKSLEEALSVSGVDKIQVPTVNKYLQTYSDMFEWGRRNGFIEKNHFSGLSIRINKSRVQKNREAFSKEEVNRLLCAINENRDGLIRKEYQKWGPLIGLYTGARLNEIAQICLSDIREENGVYVFDLNDDGDDKKLKTFSSRRIVPIHSQLINLGLLRYVQQLKDRGIIKLFNDFPNSAKNGRGRNLGRWFNEKLLPRIGLKREELVFHSLRHTVITVLMQADVPEPIVKAIVGHKQQGVTQQNYFKDGYTVQQLNEALQKLNY